MVRGADGGRGAVRSLIWDILIYPLSSPLQARWTPKQALGPLGLVLWSVNPGVYFELEARISTRQMSIKTSALTSVLTIDLPRHHHHHNNQPKPPRQPTQNEVPHPRPLRDPRRRRAVPLRRLRHALPRPLRQPDALGPVLDGEGVRRRRRLLRRAAVRLLQRHGCWVLFQGLGGMSTTGEVGHGEWNMEGRMC